MSTALFRGKLTTFKRKSHYAYLVKDSNKRGVTRVIYKLNPEDELLMEYIDCSTFHDLYKNKVFRKALDRRLICLESKQYG